MEMITLKERFQNKGTTVCLFLENPRSCIILILTKKKKVTDNKTFWKTIKPFLSNKIVSREKLALIEEDQIVESDINTVQILNIFFSNIVNHLKIAEYANCDPILVTSTIQMLNPL